MYLSHEVYIIPHYIVDTEIPLRESGSTVSLFFLFSLQLCRTSNFIIGILRCLSLTVVS